VNGTQGVSRGFRGDPLTAPGGVEKGLSLSAVEVREVEKGWPLGSVRTSYVLRPA